MFKKYEILLNIAKYKKYKKMSKRPKVIKVNKR